MPSASEPVLPLAEIFTRIPPDREAFVHDRERWSYRGSITGGRESAHAVIETSARPTVEHLGTYLGEHLASARHPRSITLSPEPVRDDAGNYRKPRFKEPA